VGGPHNDDNIAEAELRAVLLAVKTGIMRDFDVDNFVVATDSMVAKGWIEGGNSDRPEAKKLLRELFGLLEGEKRRHLFVPYINTKLNAADTPTRSQHATGDVRALEKDRMEATQNLVRQAAQKARTLGVLQGKTVLKESGKRRQRDETKDEL
jgi:hypothetical protein